jgi:hypothetical protein
MMLLALRRDGIAGVCGVCGEIGFPGEEDVEAEVPAIMGGRLPSWRLEDEEDRWSKSDDDNESESWALESRMRWYLLS